jgi:hypothetical protein
METDILGLGAFAAGCLVGWAVRKLLLLTWREAGEARSRPRWRDSSEQVSGSDDTASSEMNRPI